MTAANPVPIGMKSVSKEHASRVLLIGREPQLSRALEEALTERNCISAMRRVAPTVFAS